MHKDFFEIVIIVCIPTIVMLINLFEYKSNKAYYEMLEKAEIELRLILKDIQEAMQELYSAVIERKEETK